MTRLSSLALAAAAASLLGAVQARADVTIAVAGPLTGSEAVFGEQFKRGAEQAVADLNTRAACWARRCCW